MKISFRKRKKWEDLSVEEKLNYLKMEQESPSMIWVILMAGLIIIATIGFLATIDYWEIQDLYNQTGITPSADTNQTVYSLMEARNNMSDSAFWFMLAIVAIYIVETGWWVWKWRKFRKSIRKVKQ